MHSRKAENSSFEHHRKRRKSPHLDESYPHPTLFSSWSFFYPRRRRSWLILNLPLEIRKAVLPAGTCGKIRLAYKIASLCLNDRSVFFRRLFLLAFPAFIGVGSQGFSKRCVFARECRIRFALNPIGIEAADIATVFSIVEPRAIPPPHVLCILVRQPFREVCELSCSLAFVDLEITTARLPAVRTAHDAAPAKANRPNNTHE